ncbi:MAG: hypothetical protein ABSH48_09920 [Verrucomicrobiota bacterium]|jgi:hypothetical protein
MSLINDALKQARKAPPRNTPTALPPLQPAARESFGLPEWLLPAIVVILVIGAIFFIGWAVANHSMHSIVAAPPSATEAAQQEADVSLPVVKPRTVEPPPPPPRPDAPKLQGIFYSPTSPSAIIDGKTVRPGDQFHEYKVKAISKYTVTLVGPDKKEFQIGMGN